jgi:hypothetical protein
MKAKKPLLLIVLTMILLAVALLLPAAAFGKPASNPPVSWVTVGVSGRSPDANFPGLTDLGATAACVQQLADKSLRGQVVVSVLREFWAIPPATSPTLFRYTVKTSAFTSPDWWDFSGGPIALAHGDFFIAKANNWPADLGPAPSWWASYKGAAVADFVAYVPVSQYPALLPWVGYYLAGDPLTPSIPYRFMFIDSCKPGKGDVMLNWLIGSSGWWEPTIWAVPIQAGYIQVHVGK